MPDYIKHDAAARIPGFFDLARFFIRLMKGRRLYVLAALLTLLLLSGHITMPADIRAHDQKKWIEAQDIAGIADTQRNECENIAKTSADKEQITQIQPRLAFWRLLYQKSNAIIQIYNTMNRYGKARFPRLDESWYDLYLCVSDGIAKEIIRENSEVPFRTGTVAPIENMLCNNARKAAGGKPLEPRPAYSRGQYWRSVFSGSHYLFSAPLLVLIFLLHGSFGIENECGSTKLIRSLPAGGVKLNAARVAAQSAFSLLFVCVITALCSLTYPSVPSESYLAGQGKLLGFSAYLENGTDGAAVLLPAGAYFYRAAGLYFFIALFICMLTLLVSALTKSSVAALLLPVTLLISLFLPNHMSASMDALPSPVCAAFAPQMVIEGKAALAYSPLLILYLSCAMLFALCLCLSGKHGRTPICG